MRGVIVVSVKNLNANAAAYRSRISDKVALIGVVKADGYNHGAGAIAKNVKEFNDIVRLAKNEQRSYRTGKVKI